MDAAHTLEKIVVTWLVVDLISGFVHWCEDNYGRPSARFVGRRITKPNILHHFRPRAFVTNSWFASSSLLVLACIAALLVAWILGQLSPMVVLGAVLGANANQVHKWSHRTESENGRIIVTLQRLRLVQTPSHHAGHHVCQKDSHYCVLSNVLNPILDWSRFWRGLEWGLERLFGLTKRDDDAILAMVLRSEPEFLSKAP
jgi:ubiquitin-conjugating enzyme E2 variant